MTPYFHQTPGWLKAFYPSFVWDRKEDSKILYLTFDDGPVPEVTPFVLAQLEKFDARATFFCVGENVRKHKAIFNEVVSRGHGIGNHTFHHLNGWHTDFKVYLADVERCEEVLNENGVTSEFFRPPHGRIRKKQAKALKDRYEVVMWSHLSGDFDPQLNVSSSIEAMKKASAGSILVFHDSLKASGHLKKMLPLLLLYFHDLGFRFKSL